MRGARRIPGRPRTPSVLHCQPLADSALYGHRRARNTLDRRRRRVRRHTMGNCTSRHEQRPCRRDPRSTRRGPDPHWRTDQLPRVRDPTKPPPYLRSGPTPHTWHLPFHRACGLCAGHRLRPAHQRRHGLPSVAGRPRHSHSLRPRNTPRHAPRGARGFQRKIRAGNSLQRGRHRPTHLHRPWRSWYRHP
jgi:hypothetical protein